MKRNLLDPQQIEAELKGKKRLTEKTYATSKAARIFDEEFFATLGNWDVTIFATIMQAPFQFAQQDDKLLETRYRYLLQRIELLSAERGTYANVLFDGRGSYFKELSRRFSNYLFRSNEGRASIHIADAPAFVDSSSSAGIQIADMCAYVIRVYQEKRLFETIPPSGNEYLHAISRWYRTIQARTRDLSMSSGEIRHGLYRLPTGVR